MILDKSVADQVSIWKKSKGLTDKVFSDHNCSGETCSYYQIGDVFVCETTGYVHGTLCFSSSYVVANILMIITLVMQCVMILARMLSLIQKMSSWFVQFLAIVLTDCFLHLKLEIW